MPRHIAVNNWWKYQHYKERRPVWVKLHVTYLEDKKPWPAEQRLIALLLMIVAANKDNRFTSNATWLAEELGLPVAAVRRSVTALLEDGFLRDADDPDTEQPKASVASNGSSSEDDDVASAEAMPTRVSSPLTALTEKKERIVKERTEPKYSKEQRSGIWDSLTAAFGFEATTPPMQSLKGKVVMGLLDAGATPDEVAVRARRYREQHPTWEFTMPSLLKWWDSLGEINVPYPEWVDQLPEEMASVVREFPAARLPERRPDMFGDHRIDTVTADAIRSRFSEAA